MNSQNRKNNKTKRKNNKEKHNMNLYNLYMGLNNMGHINNNVNVNDNINNIQNNYVNYLNDIEVHKFHIMIGPYVFNCVETIKDDIIELKFYIVNENKKDDICVKITILKDNHIIPGNIDTLYYNNECSISSVKLDKKDGTILMLKTALQYVHDKYPYVKSFELQDETHVNDESIGKPLITSRRLLYGKPGWYEEYFGAKPINSTIELIEYIQKNRKLIDKLIKKYKPRDAGNEWFVPQNILLITEHIPSIKNNNNSSIFSVSRKIFGTSWEITREKINSYGMEYNIKNVNIGEINNNHYKNHVNIHEHIGSNNRKGL